MTTKTHGWLARGTVLAALILHAPLLSLAQDLARIAPDPVWVRAITGQRNVLGRALAVDGTGNVFVAGQFDGESREPGFPLNFGSTNFSGLNTVPDGFVAKYGPDGTLAWARKLASQNKDDATAVATDAAGNSYVAGSFRGVLPLGAGVTLQPFNTLGAGNDMFIAKLDPAGQPVMALAAGGIGILGSGSLVPSALAVDKDGNLIVAGTHVGGVVQIGARFLTNANATALSADVFVAKFDAKGTNLWIRSGRGEGDQFPLAVAVDAAGNVAVTGYYSQTVDFSGTVLTNNGRVNLFVAKYGGTGNLLWAARGGGESGAAAGRDVAFDAAGNTYVAASISSSLAVFGTVRYTNAFAFNTSPSNNVALLKLDANGAFAWVRSLPGQAALSINAEQLRCGTGVDRDGSVYLAGAGAMAKFENGAVVWSRALPGGTTDSPGRIAVEASGAVNFFGQFSDEAIFIPGQLIASARDAFGNSRSDLILGKIPARVIPAPPVFVTQPADVKVRLQALTNLFALATGGPGPAYRWYFNGALATNPSFGNANYTGMATHRLTIGSFDTKLAGNYHVVASNQFGLATSRVAVVELDVPAPAGLGLQVFGNTNTEAGQNLQLAANYNSIVPASLQWYLNGSPLAGQTNRTLAFNPVKATDAGSYSFVVSNPGGSSTSAPVSVKVSRSTFGIGVTNNLGGQVSQLLAVEGGKVLVAAKGRFARLNADGTFDFDYQDGAVASVFAAARQPDGKILLALDFNLFRDASSRTGSGVVRLLPNGLLDPGFSTKLAQPQVRALAIQPDGKILLAGDVQTSAAGPVVPLARLNEDGSVDAGFTSPPNIIGSVVFPAVQAMKIAATGQILLGGGINSVGPLQLSGVVRLGATGVPDATYRPAVPGWVSSLEPLPDGGVVIGGSFSGAAGGKPLANLGRLKPDGTFDPAFPANCNSTVDRILLQADGKVIAAGAFFQYAGAPSGPLVRVNPDGSRDTTFTAGTDLPVNGNARVLQVAVGTDGTLWMGGFSAAGFGAPSQFLKRYPAAAPGTIINPPVVNGGKVPVRELSFGPAGLAFTIPTTGGTKYIIETKVEIAASTWTLLKSLTGDGSAQAVVVPATGATGFVRIRAE